MRAGQAYISSLGTTGLLIASSILLLLVVGAFVAFDSWPTQAAAVPEDVAIGDPPRAEVVRTRVADRGAVVWQVASAARGARAGSGSARAADSGTRGRRVLAGLPAPSVGPRHLPDPPQPRTGGSPEDTGASHPASVASLPLPLPGQSLAPPTAELPTSSMTLDDVVSRVGDAKPADGG